MHNVTHIMDGNKLVITVDLSEATVRSAPFSSTGKTRLVGSTGGAQRIIGCPGGQDVSFALNVTAKR